MTRLVKSGKKQSKKRPARRAAAEPAELSSLDASPKDASPESAPADAAADAESAIEIVRRALAWQIEEMRLKPSKNSPDASAKARDARTLADLVRTLERLDALEKRREGKSKSKKTKVESDAEIKARILRRLDHLLAKGTTGGVSREPQSGGGGSP